MKSLKRLICIFISFSLLFVLLPPHMFAASNPLAESYRDIEYTIFIDGKLASFNDQAYLADNGTVYIPIKMFKQIGSLIAVGNGFEVKTKLNKEQVSKKDTILYKGITYISFEKFLKVSGYSGRNEDNLMVAFIWGDEDGATRTKKLMNGVLSVPKAYRSAFGSKVYSYALDQPGWIVSMTQLYQLTEVTIQSANGKTVTEYIYKDIGFSNFCYYFDYEYFIHIAFKGGEYWANKNSLPSSNPLYHLEKIKIISVDIKKNNVIVKAKRASGKSITFKLPVTDDPNEFINGLFYDSDPKKDYPGWSSNVWKLISQQKIKLGMTFNQVLLSWGSPNSTSNSTSSLGSIDIWVYGNTYVTFYNGQIYSWSDY
ncbi:MULTISPECIES: hypothetical protein [unclassified Paenibacillus]|uniref:hypothetical protein n=1 Tax=Paenibacillus sp. FSL R5-0701 TaxID=2921654 RepID=UPI0030D15DCF